LACHYLPNWYPLISEFTAETRIFPIDCDLVGELRVLGWEKFFIRDYVKSLKTSVGSVISKPEDITLVLAEMQKFRGTIEGGVCVRRFEDFVPDSERRYFVIEGKPYAASGFVPSAVPFSPSMSPPEQTGFFALSRLGTVKYRIWKVGNLLALPNCGKSGRPSMSRLVYAHISNGHHPGGTCHLNNQSV
jgi:hypothetical protein